MHHVTLDTNVAAPVANHLLVRNKIPNMVFSRLARAIVEGSIHPYISEASLTFELLPPKARVTGVLSHYAVLPGNRSHPRAHLPPPAERRIKGYRDAGFKVLHAPRVGLAAFGNLLVDMWASDDHFSLSERQARFNCFEQRFGHMGPIRLKELGAELVSIHNIDTTQVSTLPGFPSPEKQMWADGLIAELGDPRKFKTESEVLGAIRKLFSDWFDLDSVASHYAYGLDFYCTKDKGRGTSGFEILSASNRKCLSEKFNVHVVSPEELLVEAHLSGDGQALRGSQALRAALRGSGLAIQH